MGVISETGKVSFSSSDAVLNDGFEWAKRQALSVRKADDLVGLWYEAALPGRDAFCIRDVSHQRAGAAVLGLGAHTYNMLHRFAESISPLRDYCMFWEIDKSGGPAKADYKNDKKFWYNLPANFDMLFACRNEYLWSADERYIKDPDLLNFYKLSCSEYIARWDRDSDGFPEHYRKYKNRGIASYNEQGFKPYMAGDLISAQYAAFKSYAEILEWAGRHDEAAAFCRKAGEVKAYYLADWFNREENFFYGAMNKKDKFFKGYYKEGNYLPVYFGILDGTEYLDAALRQICENGAANVEAKSYFPQFYYEKGREEDAYRELCELCSPTLERREYPEVSFSAAAAIVNQYMGVVPSGVGELRTLSRLNASDWAGVKNLPVFGGEISVRHEGRAKTEMSNLSGMEYVWKACFIGEHQTISVNGVPYEARHEKDAAGGIYSFCGIPVGEKCNILACVE